MDRVAVVTDLHANMPALEATLARSDELEAEAVYCGGDLVGYGPHPTEVGQLIEERAIATIYGNYDYAIARERDDCGCFYPTPKDREIAQGSVAWTLAHTDERSKRFMRDLPFDLRFELACRRVRLVHGSPRKVNEYLLEDRAMSTFVRIAQLADCDILLFGTRTRRGSASTAVSSSSTAARWGSPRTAIRAEPSRCSKDQDGTVNVSIVRVRYDAKAVADQVRAVGLPLELADQLVRAK